MHAALDLALCGWLAARCGEISETRSRFVNVRPSWRNVYINSYDIRLSVRVPTATAYRLIRYVEAKLLQFSVLLCRQNQHYFTFVVHKELSKK